MDEAELARLDHELLSQIDVPGSLPLGGRSAALHDLRTYFIAVAAYANATMHYNFSRGAPRRRLQTLDSARQNPPRSASPPGVQQRHRSFRNNQIDRNAIGHGDGEKDAWCHRDPSIDGIDLYPPTTGIESHDLSAMHLPAEDGGVELLHFPAEGEPPVHHLTYRLRAPEAEIEAAAPLVATASNARDDSVLCAPIGDFEPGNAPWHGGLADLR